MTFPRGFSICIYHVMLTDSDNIFFLKMMTTARHIVLYFGMEVELVHLHCIVLYLFIRSFVTLCFDVDFFVSIVVPLERFIFD